MPDDALLIARLRAAGCVFAEEEAAILRSSARSDAELEEFVSRRVSGVPLERVVGWAAFCGLRVIVEPGVFVPRPRTERLVARATAEVAAGDSVIDLCCGSGAVGLALATLRPGVRLVAADLDPTAVAVARRNLEGIGDVVEGDLFAPVPTLLRGSVSLITIVAPYVATDDLRLLPREARDFEPRGTLDGGADGMDILRRAIGEAPEWLVSGGVLITEVTEEQAPVAADLIRAAGMTPEIDTDDELGSTLVLARA